jgi:hypothetical protein
MFNKENMTKYPFAESLCVELCDDNMGGAVLYVEKEAAARMALTIVSQYLAEKIKYRDVPQIRALKNGIDALAIVEFEKYEKQVLEKYVNMSKLFAGGV